jgi:tellurite resistance protein TerC
MKLLRRVVIAIMGGTILLIGIVMIVLPAPSILVIPIGLGILALEFAWARVWLDRVRSLLARKKPEIHPSDK